MLFFKEISDTEKAAIREALKKGPIHQVSFLLFGVLPIGRISALEEDITTVLTSQHFQRPRKPSNGGELQSSRILLPWEREISILAEESVRA
jgi:hypothetical protein